MVSNNSLVGRSTKYCVSLRKVLATLGHATNNQLLVELRKLYPGLSATTVHRASARLAGRGEIGIAPAAKDGSKRYDANIKPHDHFHCTKCDGLRDTDVKASIKPILEASIGDCRISGRLTISGICMHCIKLIREE